MNLTMNRIILFIDNKETEHKKVNFAFYVPFLYFVSFSQISFLEIKYRCYFLKIRYSDFNYLESKF